MKTTLHYVLRYVENIQRMNKDLLSDMSDLKKVFQSCGNAIPARQTDDTEPTTVASPSVSRADAWDSQPWKDRDALPAKVLHGWYYFGERLPEDVLAWCEVMPSRGGLPNGHEPTKDGAVLDASKIF